ncbi:MAG: hypothetical protein GXP42_02525 [Chloroflexi bacterium]|nr:hypothetical protein [Chloroflexota bacterium]
MSKTSIAVLGTLAEFHKESIPFDLNALVQLVYEINPDLLCLDISPEQWRTQDFDDLPPEYREALLPLAYQTDIVVVPIGESLPPREPGATGWRGKAILLLRNLLAWLEKTAPGPEAINSGWRHDLANHLYELTLRLGQEDAVAELERHRRALIENIVAAARRDPGARILVVVNVRHCHHIRPALRHYEDIEVKDFSEL